MREIFVIKFCLIYKLDKATIKDMNNQDFIQKMKKIYQNLLEFLDKENDNEEYFQNLISNIEEAKIPESKSKFRTFLYILAKISANHHRYPNFIDKIEKIILSYKFQLMLYFSNLDILKMFRNNKRILLFLIQSKIINKDHQLIWEMLKDIYQIHNCCEYLFPQKLFTAKITDKLDEDFEKKQKIGENDDFLNQIIREDNIEEFIIYVKKNDYPLQSTINPSIYETNIFLIKKPKTTLIEYTAFF